MPRLPASPLAACLIGVAALIAVPAPALAAKKKRERVQFERFEVTISGGQVNKWSVLSTTGDDSCGSQTFGSGKENIVFTTPKAHKLLATRSGKGSETYGSLLVDTRASVTRDGYLDSKPVGSCEGVAEGDGSGGPPPAPDCGTRNGKLTLELDFDKDELGLDDADTAIAPFDNCHAEGFSFPDIITASRGKVRKAELPTNDIFSKKKKLVAETTAYLTDDSYGTFFETTLYWKVTLKRVSSTRR
jgi:hypothetical protein